MSRDEEIADLERLKRSLATQVEATRYELRRMEMRLDEVDRRLIDLRKAKYGRASRPAARERS